jgi:hypothetical protein
MCGKQTTAKYRNSVVCKDCFTKYFIFISAWIMILLFKFKIKILIKWLQQKKHLKLRLKQN